VSDGVVVRFLGHEGVRGILGDGVAEFALGERWGDLIYLRGTDATVAARRSKIEGAAAGGEIRARETAATGARGPDGKFVVSPTIDQPTLHRSPADSPPRTSVDPRSQIPDPAEDLPPARDPAVPAPEPARTYDPNNPRDVGRLAEATYARVSDARIEVAADLGLPEPLPFPPVTPATHSRGFVELKSRIREEGAGAPAACDRVVANLIAQARAKRSLDWLSQRAFGDKAWPNARDGIDPSARAGPRGSAERAPKRDLRAGRIEPSNRDAYGPDGETDCP
jgi:hypothetical protein